MVATNHIQIKNLSKSYKGVPVVHGISMDIMPGGITIVYGDHGTGKTTLLDCIAGMVEPDSPDSVVWPDDSLTAIDKRRKIGYVPAEDDTIEYLTGLEYISLVAAAYKKMAGETLERAMNLAHGLGMEAGTMERLIHAYDPRDRRKLQLAAILAADPPIVIIDEPTQNANFDDVERLMTVIESDRYKNTAFIIGTTSERFARSLTATEIIML
jgi:ABC-2 type transport system ATP-binding protein